MRRREKEGRKELRNLKQEREGTGPSFVTVRVCAGSLGQARDGGAGDARPRGEVDLGWLAGAQGRDSADDERASIPSPSHLSAELLLRSELDNSADCLLAVAALGF